MLLSLLTILFVGLKLTGFIDWSWWFVVMPALAHAALVVSVFAVTVILTMRKNR
jgi:hypothetical protein